MSAVLRPGRFLGNHYLAFTVPGRTFIITLDRLKNGIRVARRNKLEADREEKMSEAGRPPPSRGGDRKRRSRKKSGGGMVYENRNVARSLSSREAYPDLVGDDVGSIGVGGPAEAVEEEPTEDSGSAVIDTDGTLAEEREEENSKGFLGRFVEGYLGAGNDDEVSDKEINDRLIAAISEWFSKQGEEGQVNAEMDSLEKDERN